MSEGNPAAGLAAEALDSAVRSAEKAFAEAADLEALSRAKPAHLGKTTQVWDVVVTNEANGKTIALFRCTQMILYPRR